MSRLLDIQVRLNELGRIRLGEKGARGEPKRLTKFRLTSASRAMLEQAAAVYGGTVRAWKGAPDEGFWELYTEADALDILIPPTLAAYSQFYELWSGGGCERRCDGEIELLSGGPCRCDPEARECQVTTRVSVMLPRIAGLGVWRLETRGWNAAATLPSTLELLGLSGRGSFVPGVLRLEQRSVKRRVADKDGVLKVQTQRFVVPVIDVAGTIGELLAAGAAGDGRHLPGVHPAVELSPGPSRPPRGTKVPRPELPEGEPLPDEAAPFRPPETVAGWDVEPAAASTAPMPEEAVSPAPVEAPDGGSGPNVAAPAAPPDNLTREQFQRLLGKARISPGQVIAAAQEIYGRGAGFSDEERAVIAAALGLV